MAIVDAMSDIGSELQASELAGLTRTDVTLAIAVAACERLAPLAAAVLRDRPPVAAAVCSDLWTLVDAVEGDEVESPVAPGLGAAVGPLWRVWVRRRNHLSGCPPRG